MYITITVKKHRTLKGAQQFIDNQHPNVLETTIVGPSGEVCYRHQTNLSAWDASQMPRLAIDRPFNPT